MKRFLKITKKSKELHIYGRRCDPRKPSTPSLFSGHNHKNRNKYSLRISSRYGKGWLLFPLLSILIMLVILDIVSTMVGLGKGAIEGNPFGITAWSFLIFKLMAPGVIALLCWAGKDEPDLSTLLFSGLVILIVWYTFVVVNNFSFLLK